ncbi:hypothetical protein F5051DRAFT_337883 [Lentinula edodes]|nr:hypothetical protein F5051DRAFT_337883 [Lentinula edodes]
MTKAVPNTVLYPEDAIDDKQARSWLPQAFNYVNVDLGSQYASLITAWIALERSTHWNTHAQVRLSTIKRPTLLGKWVERKRYSVRGNEPNIEQNCGFEFAEEFEIWWISLQPGWRQGASGNKLVSPIPISKDQDWKGLDKFGLNGWFGLVVCLKWLGINLRSRQMAALEVETTKWIDMVVDVCSMMEALTLYRSTLLEHSQ